MKKTIIIGLGNPLRGDDAVGLRIARVLKERLADRADIDVVEAYRGGIALAETAIGYERAIVIDTMAKKAGQPGTVVSFTPSPDMCSRNSGSLHDASLCDALSICCALGEAVPKDVLCWGIVPKEIETFSEALTDEIEALIPVVADQIIAKLNEQGE
ncbi:MAG TPA: hydrogenase maturation protease [Dissulfurispiraceae bacterium]|nr:hydrogenase maturation protease [Dissulfurispiraceae bacterium]